MTQRSQQLGSILLVEDEDTDAQLIIRAFEKASVQNRIHHVQNAEDAFSYLYGKPPFQDRLRYTMPVLVLLDLRLPDLPGFNVLHVIRGDKELRAIPVVVLTADSDPRTIKNAYDAGANSYLLKSSKPDEVRCLVNMIIDYWLKLNRTPSLVMAASGS